MSESKDPPAGLPPCPGCGNTGAPSKWYAGEERVQLWECVEDPEDCRVRDYRRRDCDPQKNITGDYSE